MPRFSAACTDVRSQDERHRRMHRKAVASIRRSGVRVSIIALSKVQNRMMCDPREVNAAVRADIHLTSAQAPSIRTSGCPDGGIGRRTSFRC